MGFLRVGFNGECAGQDVVNVFWFVHTYSFSVFDDFTEFVDAVSAELAENYLEDGVPGDDNAFKLADLMPNDYLLRTMEFIGYTDGFLPVAGMPITHTYNTPGKRTPVHTGPASVVVAKKNLMPGFGPGIGLPRRGHWKFGPVCADMIGEDGQLTEVWLPRWQGMGAAMAATVVAESPFEVIWPIVVRETRVAGVLTDLTYRRISSVAVRAQTSFLRTRQPEA